MTEQAVHPELSAGLANAPAGRTDDARRSRFLLVVLLVAVAVFAGCMISPPSLMDDVDAVQAQTRAGTACWQSGILGSTQHGWGSLTSKKRRSSTG